MVQDEQQSNGNSVQQAPDAITATTLNNETIRTLIYKSLHEFQPWFHGKISREEAERRIEDGLTRDGKFLVRERDNYSYAMCISHKRTTKHYRIDVLPTGELAIQDGRKFTSLMSLVSHYTIMSDGLWCALTEACARPIQTGQLPVMLGNALQLNGSNGLQPIFLQPTDNGQLKGQRVSAAKSQQDVYCTAPMTSALGAGSAPQALPERLVDMFGGQGRHGCDMTHQSQQQQCLGEQLNCRASLGNRLNPSAGSGSLNANQQGAVSTIKAPIREWLQTINHKWSQLMASKSHHQQSLNSFLFGTQNPLNNHCRHHNRHRHHLSQQHQLASAKRKCRNGHTSCVGRDRDRDRAKSQTASASQLQLATQQQVNMAANPPAYQAGVCQDSLKMGFARTNCCHNMNASNLVLPAPTSANNRSILSHLPQNSGFTLSSQSFIGSPLFSVRQKQPMACLAAAGSNSQPAHSLTQVSGSSESSLGSARGPAEGRSSSSEEAGEPPRLISPAHSVSTNLVGVQQQAAGVPYNPQVADIYGGSQGSTVLVNDHRQPTTSSSSSSGNIIQHAGCISAGSLALLHQQHQHHLNQQQQQHVQTINVLPGKPLGQSQVRRPVQFPLPVGEAARDGRIVCGQHAGPAFRYTNCDDDNLNRHCLHHQRAQTGAAASLVGPARASDDLHLNMASSQLVGPAALTKFVQFQDGQCLRTHRDTMSIKMAYLSSRQAGDFRAQVPKAKEPQSGLATKQQAVAGGRELAHFCQPAGNNARHSYNSNLALNSSLNYGLVGAEFVSQTQMQQMNNNGINNNMMVRESALAADYQQPVAGQAALRAQTTGALAAYGSSFRNNQQANLCEIDLMDCGGGGDGDDATEGRFNFKYDPKLIKSSSIETLCGHANSDDANNNNDQLELMNCKSNRELVMSLQRSQQQQQQFNCQGSILSPMQVGPTANPAGRLGGGGGGGSSSSEEEEDEDENESARRTESFLSRLMTGSGAPGNQVDEKLNHMSKKHDIDALTTSLLEELTASLKAQVDLKNKRSGLAQQATQANYMDAANGCCRQQQPDRAELARQEHKFNGHHLGCCSNNNNDKQLIDGLVGQPGAELNPAELINEFDTLVSNNR